MCVFVFVSVERETSKRNKAHRSIFLLVSLHDCTLMITIIVPVYKLTCCRVITIITHKQSNQHYTLEAFYLILYYSTSACINNTLQ